MNKSKKFFFRKLPQLLNLRIFYDSSLNQVQIMKQNLTLEQRNQIIYS